MFFCTTRLFQDPLVVLEPALQSLVTVVTVCLQICAHLSGFHLVQLVQYPVFPHSLVKLLVHQHLFPHAKYFGRFFVFPHVLDHFPFPHSQYCSALFPHWASHWPFPHEVDLFPLIMKKSVQFQTLVCLC